MTAAAIFEYEQAFAGQLGLLTSQEQARLRTTTIGLPGLGGAGGAHLLTLTRLGVGRFVLADPDRFELRNLNRQAGATMDTLGQPKTDVLAGMARAINPDVALRLLPDGITADNIDVFLDGCEVVVDGLDFFAMQARRLLFRRGLV